MRQILVAFLAGLFVGALTLSASAQQPWDLPASIHVLADKLDVLTARLDTLLTTLAKDGVSGNKSPGSGPVLMLTAPNGTVLPAQATKDGRLRIANQ